MAHQLILIDETPREWILDDHTREIGREGLRLAREILSKIPSPSEIESSEAPTLTIVEQSPASGDDSAHQTAA